MTTTFAAPPPPAATEREPFRVLTIEDDLSIARLLAANVAKARMKFRHAATGEAGLRAFEEFEPHLVLLDLMLPDIHGYDICTRIRQESTVPVIMLTACNTAEHEIRGLKCGADDYVSKPFDPALLMARVATHLRRAHRYNAAEAASSASIVPAAWSKCGRCGYMGPHEKFEEIDERFHLKRACPHCQAPMTASKI